MASTAHIRAPAAGELAPDFTLDSTSGAPVTLSAFSGRQNVLIAFFPLAFTSVCTAELCDLSSDYDQFTSRDVAVLPVSVDSVLTLREFKRNFLIDKDGRVAWAHVESSSGQRRTNEEILQQIRALP